LIVFRKARHFPDGKYLFSFRNPSLTRVESSMNGEWRKEWKRFVMNNQSTFLKKKVGFVDDYIYEWIQ
jgi:hypothetical protein